MPNITNRSSSSSMSGLMSAAPQRAGLRVSTDSGTFNVNPSQDPEGYKRLLGDSADRRRRLRYAADDAEQAALPTSVRAEAQAGTQFGRMQSEAANGPNGWNRQWTPFFEQFNVAADNSGKRQAWAGLDSLPENYSVADDPAWWAKGADAGPYGASMEGIPPSVLALAQAKAAQRKGRA